LPGPSKFCSRASKNGRWASEIGLSSLVSDNFPSKTILKFKATQCAKQGVVRMD